MVGNNGSNEWVMERRSLVGGSLIWNQTQVLSVADDNLRAIDMDEDFVYLGGSHGTGWVWHWAIQKRYKSNGDLIWEVLEEDPNPEGQIYGLCQDEESLYMAGEAGGTDRWRSQGRRKSDGGLIWEKESNNYPYGYDIARSIDSG